MAKISKRENGFNFKTKIKLNLKQKLQVNNFKN